MCCEGMFGVLRKPIAMKSSNSRRARTEGIWLQSQRNIRHPFALILIVSELEGGKNAVSLL